jgi:GcrA cell cycle regulator
MRKWTTDDKALVEKLWREGHTSTKIAAMIGITRNSVIGKIRRMGLQGLQGSDEPAHPKSEPSVILNAPRIVPAIKHTRRKLRRQLPNHCPISVLKLTDQRCHFPVTPDHTRYHLFCGAPSREKSPYCSHHHAMCYYEMKQR